MRDVAISFLHQDQALAERIQDALAGQLDVFVYSRAQDELVATNGLETFRDVFRRDSRLVVVLYREPWGARGWTGVEARAIGDRFLNDGPGFLMFVQLESHADLPPWVPESDIRLRFDLYGFEGLLGAIKVRAQQSGASLRTQTAVERAALVQRDLELSKKRETFRHSPDGAQLARAEVALLFERLEGVFGEVQTNTSGLGIRFGRDIDSFAATTSAVSLSVSWNQRYGNSLDQSNLLLLTMLGPLRLPNEQGYYITKPIDIDEERYDPNLSASGVVWRGRDEQELSTSALAEHCAGVFLETIQKHGEGQFSNLRRRRRNPDDDFELL